MAILLNDGTEWPVNTAYNGDCLDFMRRLPDKCIDLVLTDPPYGIMKKGKNLIENKSDTKDFNVKWDDEIPEKNVFDEIFRISKHQIIWGCQYFTGHLPHFKGPIVWDKKNGASMYADGEMAFSSCSNSLRIIPHQWCGAFKDSERGETPIHPTQKPLYVFKWCLEKYAPENALVFDPFLGSFTTAVACHHYGLNWIGCEKDPDYFRDGSERYKREAEQGFLF